MAAKKSVAVQFGSFNHIVVFECSENRLAAAGVSERTLLLETIRVAYKKRNGPNNRCYRCKTTSGEGCWLISLRT